MNRDRSGELGSLDERRYPIVGPLPDQRRLRRAQPIETLDSYLRFLEEIDELFGPVATHRNCAPPGPFLL